MEDLKYVIESLLFVSGDPLTLDRIRSVLPERQTGEIRSALSALSEEYDARKGGFHLCEVAGGFQLRSRPEYAEWIRRLLEPPPARMGRASLEVLAIIAYKQPIIRSDIETIRGVDCGGILRTLLERKLIRILGRKDIPGRPLIYGTTRQFLEMFDLKGLADLPTLQEIEALGEARIETDQGPVADTGLSEETSEKILDGEASEPLYRGPCETAGDVQRSDDSKEPT